MTTNKTLRLEEVHGDEVIYKTFDKNYDLGDIIFIDTKRWVVTGFI